MSLLPLPRVNHRNACVELVHIAICEIISISSILGADYKGWCKSNDHAIAEMLRRPLHSIENVYLSNGAESHQF